MGCAESYCEKEIIFFKFILFTRHLQWGQGLNYWRPVQNNGPTYMKL